MRKVIAAWVGSFFVSMAFAQSEFEKQGAQVIVGHPEYNRPLQFSVMGQELKIKNVHIQYDLKKYNGEKLEIGPLVFDENSFVANIEDSVLKFSWDKNFVSTGTISMFNQQGKELWKHEAEGVGHLDFTDLKGSKAPQWRHGEKFRFCLHSSIEKGYSIICTPWYGVEIRGSSVTMGRAKSEAVPRVILKNEEKNLSATEIVSLGKPVQFLAVLKNNATYEFVSEPSALVVKDLIESDKKGWVTLTAEMPQPLKLDSVIIPGRNEGKIAQTLGFESTIGVDKDLWQADVSVENSTLTLPGKSGGVFSYVLEINNPPSVKSRRFISKNAIKGTYKSQDELMVLNSTGSIEKWEFQVPDIFSVNTVYLDVPGENGTHKASYEIYRSAPREVSVRLTGVMTSQKEFVPLAETHLSWWFNDIFGSQNYYLSKQRWGVSARYFSSLINLKTADSGGGSLETELKAAQADLRYRLTPGLWERDETLGLIAAYEAMAFGGEGISKMGVGVFWARSMPRVFDFWFSKLPFMNYPKWVDMELIRYVASADSDVSLGDDFALNFHGKVLWTPRLFGEAGFGLKNYYYEKKSDGSGARLTTFYGTVGLGINF